MVTVDDLIQHFENLTNFLDDLYETDNPITLPAGWDWDDVLNMRDVSINFLRQLEDGEPVKT